MSAIALVTEHLVRRSADSDPSEGPADPDPKQPFPLMAVIILYSTLAILCVISGCVGYIYGKVVTTLAAVEDPNPDVYVRIDDDHAPLNPEITGDDAADVPPQKPVTSGLKSTISHLTARAGRWAPFRGLLLYILTGLAINIITYPMSASFHIYGSAFARFFAEILLANLRVGWIHIVISEPSAKSLWSRIPSWRKTFMKIAPAAALRSLAAQIVTFVPLVIVYSTKVLEYGSEPSARSPAAALSGAFGLLALFLVLYVLIQIPAEVTFIRVAASMLPEDDETIVPFDRSFGGKVTPEIIGGQGKIGIVDAWRSFSWGSRMRFLGIVGKVFLLQTALGLMFGVILFGQILLFFGNKGFDVTAMATTAAGRMLARQLQQMQSDKDIPGISCGLVDNNVFEWEVMLMISDDCKFYGGGFFRARLTFPPEYPHMPPKMKFETPIFHPNIYPSGEVCISILHPPEEDKYGYESAAERWSPVQTPETILLSVISMLSSPNDESPANVEAARLWRDDPKEFKKRVRKCVRDSLGED
ncbi:ubiquitin conjugating enzyme, putative [Talaromyces stipitatus ATCC 10500]|uniref:Ubiquitin-conjugating enzyme E2 2 n=1 Tax=Talaromyces stipitatus (strain ATCC 10500 / CBS 375.48 / QM 6759 / NRRL 1006) TaxID=441959 RepID=B8M668_TALSN|nr:ubiquitin conjugating enzyme, putative [Talaromyces stipitatus ATCC 10500]EED19068.1 ubiquitin conjugating enzyme, putative [Talaromyces stipitatus ATCC 10500]